MDEADPGMMLPGQGDGAGQRLPRHAGKVQRDENVVEAEFGGRRKPFPIRAGASFLSRAHAFTFRLKVIFVCTPQPLAEFRCVTKRND